jgi:hypothetical protein
MSTRSGPALYTTADVRTKEPGQLDTMLFYVAKHEGWQGILPSLPRGNVVIGR